MSIGSDAAMTIAFFGAAASVAWSAAFAWAKWLARPRHSEQITGDVGRRLRSIEVAVEAIAIEVERIGEAQRFAARVIEERLPEARHGMLPRGPSGSASRSITPH